MFIGIVFIRNAGLSKFLIVRLNPAFVISDEHYLEVLVYEGSGSNGFITIQLITTAANWKV